MQTLRKRWLPILLAALVIGGPVAWYKWPSTASAAEAALTAPVKHGDSRSIVTTTGELRARKFVQIQGPNSRRRRSISRRSPGSCPEGTVVKEGDKIAELDRAPAATRLADRDARPPKGAGASSRTPRSTPRSTCRRRARTCAPPSTGSRRRSSRRIRRSTRRRRSSARPRSTTRRRSARSTSPSGISTRRPSRPSPRWPSRGADLGASRTISRWCRTRSPASRSTRRRRDGHLRSRVERQEEGRRLAVEHVGSDRRDAARSHADGVADVRQRSRRAEARASDRTVAISLDADPTKKLTGKVTAIANVGEQRPNQDSKVFEVKIEVAKADTTLRPGMTTSNAIEVASIPNVLSIPLEAVTSDSGYSYVYKKDGRGIVRQMIETGAMNDNEIVVRQGLAAGRSRAPHAAGRQGDDQDGDHSGPQADRRAGARGRHGEGRDAAREARRPSGVEPRGSRRRSPRRSRRRRQQPLPATKPKG